MESPTSNPVGSPKVTDTTPTRGAGQDAPQEFTRFEDLTRKLAHVPKSEVDAKRKAP